MNVGASATVVVLISFGNLQTQGGSKLVIRAAAVSSSSSGRLPSSMIGRVRRPNDEPG